MATIATATVQPPKQGMQLTYTEDSNGRRIVLTIDGKVYPKDVKVEVKRT